MLKFGRRIQWTNVEQNENRQHILTDEMFGMSELKFQTIFGNLHGVPNILRKNKRFEKHLDDWLWNFQMSLPNIRTACLEIVTEYIFLFSHFIKWIFQQSNSACRFLYASFDFFFIFSLLKKSFKKKLFNRKKVRNLQFNSNRCYCNKDKKFNLNKTFILKNYHFSIETIQPLNSFVFIILRKVEMLWF